MIKRHSLALVPPVLILFALTGTALAHWTTGGTGSGSAGIGTLDPAAISVPGTSGGEVTVTWTQQASLPSAPSAESGISYTLQRRHGAGSYSDVDSGDCSGSLPHGTSGCTDTVNANGAYHYRVVARYHGWTATSDEAGPVDVTIAPSYGPSAVHVLDGGGNPTSWINSSTVSSVSARVQLPASSVAGDDVFVRLTDGANTISGTAAIPSNGTTTLTVSGINASSLNAVNSSNAAADNITVTAGVSRGGTESTTTATQSVGKDVTAPGGPAATQLLDGAAAATSWINAATVSAVSNRLTLPGTSAANDIATVRMSDGTNTVSGTAILPSDGTTNLTVSGINASSLNAVNSSTTAPNNITVTAKISDPAGNDSTTATQSVGKDVTAPTYGPSATQLLDAASSPTTWINAASVGSVSNRLTLPAASVATDIATVRMSDGTNTVTRTATIPANGTTTLTVSGANAGPLSVVNSSTASANNITVTAKVSDPAGNDSATTATQSIGKDVTAPAAPTNLGYIDGNGSDKVTGTAEANSTVRAQRTSPSCGGGCTIFSQTLTGGATGFNFSVDKNSGSPSSPIVVTYSVWATDRAANIGPAASITFSDVD